MRHGTCFHRRLSARRAGAAPHSAVAELGVVRRHGVTPEERNAMNTNSGLPPRPASHRWTIGIFGFTSFGSTLVLINAYTGRNNSSLWTMPVLAAMHFLGFVTLLAFALGRAPHVGLLYRCHLPRSLVYSRSTECLLCIDERYMDIPLPLLYTHYCSVTRLPILSFRILHSEPQLFRIASFDHNTK